MEKKKVSVAGTLAVFSLFLLSMGITVVTPAMNVIIERWAATVSVTNIYMVSTIPTLVMVPVTIVAGSLAGKKVKYRTLAVLGAFLFLLGGCAPAVLPENFILLLACRAVFGVGVGLMAPLGNALVVGLYEPGKASAYLGYGTLLMNFGGIIFQQLGGFFAGISWNATFWGHAFGLVGFVMAFFIPEPELPAEDSSAASAPKEKMHPFAWFAAITLFIFNIANYPLMMNLSTFMAQKNAGDAQAAAIVLSVYTVGGCISGLIFGKIYGVVKRFSVSLGLAICVVGICVAYFGANVATIGAGMFLDGFGFSIMFPALIAFVGMLTPPSTQAFGISIVTAFMNLSSFFSAYYLVVIEHFSGKDNVIGSSYFWAMAILGILAVFYIFYNPIKNVNN
ncbi:Major Facilitator Superfamily protein [Acetitomaculum ruminis DSM 5522]|uniref:Major Facilitator Superfamily protein n=1 Tax=Acetitomaculum ruminis DSM 5522 TaxID=1120918 RepID=A0A1I0XLY4_9FIRM|nr:MFS transporter [Acetitomaculum ruminis]SFB01914.1 Major Facilitator Superfamily protein [Acetitomaculum ruminis DSM 5522]